MPDISMCANQTCSKRQECYRFTATPNPSRQTYAEFTPEIDKGKEFSCNHFCPDKQVTVTDLNPPSTNYTINTKNKTT